MSRDSEVRDAQHPDASGRTPTWSAGDRFANRDGNPVEIIGPDREIPSQMRIRWDGDETSVYITPAAITEAIRSKRWRRLPSKPADLTPAVLDELYPHANPETKALIDEVRRLRTTPRGASSGASAPQERSRLRGGPERCSKPCSECRDGQHHFGDMYIEFAEDEPNHPAAIAGLESWFQCKHCDAWMEYDPDSDDDDLSGDDE